MEEAVQFLLRYGYWDSLPAKKPHQQTECNNRRQQGPYCLWRVYAAGNYSTCHISCNSDSRMSDCPQRSCQVISYGSGEVIYYTPLPLWGPTPSSVISRLLLGCACALVGHWTYKLCVSCEIRVLCVIFEELATATDYHIWWQRYFVVQLADESH